MGRLELNANVTVKNFKNSFGIIIVWSSKFLARKNCTQANFFKPVYIGCIARSSLL